MTKRILLVDDERDVLFGMHEYFSALGYAVDCATELEEAQAMEILPAPSQGCASWGSPLPWTTSARATPTIA